MQSKNTLTGPALRRPPAELIKHHRSSAKLRSTERIQWLLVWVIAAAGLSITGVALSPAPTYVWLALGVIAVCLLGSLLDLRDGTVDLLSPMVVFSVTWSVMFGVRPILMFVYDDTSLRGTYNFPSYLERVQLLGLAGAVAFLIGYQVAIRESNRFKRLRHSQSPSRKLRLRFGAAFTLSVIGVAACIIGFQGSLGGVSAYVYYMPLILVPTAAVLFQDALQTRLGAAWILFAVDSFAFLVRFGLTGQRAFVLFLLLAVAVIYFMRRGKTPGLVVSGVLGSIFLGGIFYGLELQRATYRGGDSHADPISASAAFETIFMGGTTEMVPSLTALLATEDFVWEQEPGRTSYVAAVHWVPSAVWAGKPTTYDEAIYARLFPEHYAVDKANTQFSIVGDFYTDSGPLGVGIGMIATGIFAGTIYARARFKRSPRSVLIYALFPLLFVTTLRGNIALNLGIGLFLFAPLWILLRTERASER